MGRKKNVSAIGWLYLDGKLLKLGPITEPKFPTTTQRQAMQRKANAKRRRRDRELKDG